MCFNTPRCIHFDSFKGEKMMKSDTNNNMRAKKGRSKKKRLLWFLLIPLLIVTLGAGGYSFHIYSKAKSILNNAYSELGRGDKSNKREKAVKPMTDNISVLIMGVDESDIREKIMEKQLVRMRYYLQQLIKTINPLNL